MSLNELFPELFHVLSGHLPLAYRPSTLLSLALTCQRLHEIVIPHLLYENVRLVGEDQILPTLNTLIARVEKEKIQKKGNPSPSHCIRHLCIEHSINTPIHTLYDSIVALQKLVNVDGLPHLSALTLHVSGGRRLADGYLTLPSSFLESLRTKCPHLKSVHSTGLSQELRNNWIDPPGLFSIESLTSIRVEGFLEEYLLPITINFSQLPPNLHTLELRLYQHRQIDASGLNGLLSCIIPNLNTLILDGFTISDPTSANLFWGLHPRIKRLEFGRHVTGSWFDDFEVGMLPNLRYLQCDALGARILLPLVSKTLIRLSLLDTYNAQGPYLLRALVPDGVLPALRSLTIHREQGNTPKSWEGHQWREDENGGVLQVDAKSSREYDGNYIMSISKAAPNLEELELVGTSDGTLGPDAISIQDPITASLSLFPKLQRLTLSGGLTSPTKPFFPQLCNSEDYAELGFDVGADPEKSYPYGKYAPKSFNQAARDLADGCRTLDVVTMGNMIGGLLIQNGLGGRIVRESEGGPVKRVKRIRAWGNIIGREEEW